MAEPRGRVRRSGKRDGAEGWETIHVFVSSTFADMDAERAEVHRVLRDLDRDLARPNGAFLVPVDLRWGVETRDRDEEADKELHVLDVCIGEVRRSGPFFIGLLGDRYGSLPELELVRRAAQDAGIAVPASPVSLTELELQVGVFDVSDDERRSFVLLRRPLPYDEMAPDVAARYSDRHAPPGDATAPRRARALEDLRRRVRATLGTRVEDYSVGFDLRTGRISDLQELGAVVERRLSQELEPWLAERRGTPARLGPVGVELEGYLRERLATLVGRGWSGTRPPGRRGT